MAHSLPRYRHKKRGTTYVLLGYAEVQADEPLVEGDIVAVYRADSDGKLWVRRRDKFEDGRFENITETPEYREMKEGNNQHEQE